jgi:hypothetical protein
MTVKKDMEMNMRDYPTLIIGTNSGKGALQYSL